MLCFTGSLAFRNTLPTQSLYPSLFLQLNDLLQLRLVLGLTAGSGRILNNARRLWLAHALAGICLYGLGGRKFPWLAFSHCKVEYGIVRARVEVPGIFICEALSEDGLSDEFFR